jgi:hypothetical protein
MKRDWVTAPFPVTATGGRLYLDSTGVYYDEAVVDMLVERVGHRKAETEVELLAVINESDRGLPAIRVWVHEALEPLMRRLREESRTFS